MIKKKKNKKEEVLIQAENPEFANQVIEVDYNKDLVEEYKKQYIMEKEGIGTDPSDITPFDQQTITNEVPLADMIEAGEVIIEEVDTDDQNN